MLPNISQFRKQIYLLCLIGVSMSGSIYGYNIGAMSGILLLVKGQMALTHAEASLFVSSFSWGIVLIMFIMWYAADHIGRKKILILSTLIATIGVFVTVSAHHISGLILGRLLVGVSSGMMTITVPLYLSETVPCALRGRSTVAFQLFLTFGILLSTLVSWHFIRQAKWQPIFYFELIPIALLLILSFCVPESPRWLVMHNKSEKALAILEKTRSKKESEQVLSEMLASKASHHHVSRFKGLLHKRYLKPLLLVASLGSLNQLTGINAILQYDSTILFLSGFNQHNAALLGSVLITGLNFIMTIVAICIVDRFERRSLLRFGLVGVILCLLGVSIVHHFLNSPILRAELVTLLLLGFIVFFAIAPGAVVWTFMSELLPTKIRSPGISVAVLVGSATGALFSAIFLPLQQLIGFSGIFLFCALTSVLYLMVSYMLPQTNRRSLEEIEKGMLRTEQ